MKKWQILLTLQNSCDSWFTSIRIESCAKMEKMKWKMHGLKLTFSQRKWLHLQFYLNHSTVIAKRRGNFIIIAKIVFFKLEIFNISYFYFLLLIRFLKDLKICICINDILIFVPQISYYQHNASNLKTGKSRKRLNLGVAARCLINTFLSYWLIITLPWRQIILGR